MSDFEAINSSNSISTGAPPQTPLGSLPRSLGLQLDFMGHTSNSKGKEERERRKEGNDISCSL